MADSGSSACGIFRLFRGFRASARSPPCTRQTVWERCKAASENPLFLLKIRRDFAAFSLAAGRSPPMHHSDFHEALQRYAQIRIAAYRAAESDVAGVGRIRHPFRFCQIDDSTLDVWRATWTRQNPLRYGHWDWEGLASSVWRRPTGFHLAIWSGDHLCGLAVGRASKRRPSGRRHMLSLNFLEANPDPVHPLKGHVAELAIVCAESYAAALGATVLRLNNPLPGVLRLYLNLGFSVAGIDAVRGCC